MNARRARLGLSDLAHRWRGRRPESRTRTARGECGTLRTTSWREAVISGTNGASNGSAAMTTQRGLRQCRSGRVAGSGSTRRVGAGGCGGNPRRAARPIRSVVVHIMMASLPVVIGAPCSSYVRFPTRRKSLADVEFFRGDDITSRGGDEGVHMICINLICKFVPKDYHSITTNSRGLGYGQYQPLHLNSVEDNTLWWLSTQRSNPARLGFSTPSGGQNRPANMSHLARYDKK